MASRPSSASSAADIVTGYWPVSRISWTMRASSSSFVASSSVPRTVAAYP